MTNILLAKPTLPADFIDVSVGEAHVVREALLSVFDILACDLPKVDSIFQYQPPQGYGPLVRILENKYQAPVIITNGAKNALGACMFALQQMDNFNVYLPRPWWALLPPLIDMHGLKHAHEEAYSDSYLCVAPNNPCGSMPDLQDLSDTANYRGKIFIHDAVYYNHIYLPRSHKLEQFGDVQIYSASKSFGLSSLRVGWIVCPNTEMYKWILQYMEHMTVGVSIISQVFLYNLLNRMHGYPSLTERFEFLAADALQESKKLIAQIDPEVLEVGPNLITTPGMFGWFKVGPKANFEKAKVNMIDGALFGVPGMVRMNLAFDKETISDIVNRLNSSKD